MANFPSAAKSALETMKAGPVSLVFDPDGASEVEIFVRNGISFTFARAQETIETDLVGVYDLYSAGDAVTFEIRTDEFSSEACAVLFMDQETHSSVYQPFGQAAGESGRTSALAVRVRPWQTRTASTLQLELWIVIPEGDQVSAWATGEQWNNTQSFRALPDLAKSNGGLIGNLTVAARS